MICSRNLRASTFETYGLGVFKLNYRRFKPVVRYGGGTDGRIDGLTKQFIELPLLRAMQLKMFYWKYNVEKNIQQSAHEGIF